MSCNHFSCILRNANLFVELRAEVKKKDEEILRIRLSLVKKKVIGAFLSKPNLDQVEPTAEEKKEKREHMKTLQEESAHMKNIIQGLDSSTKTLRLHIKKREELMRKKKEIGKILD